jgi:transposase
MIRLRDEQWERIRDHFPEEKIADGRPGRKPIPTRCVLEAVLWILNTGAQWHMLPQSYPNYKTVHRRFQTWCRDEVLRRVLTDVANELRDSGALNEEECFIDAFTPRLLDHLGYSITWRASNRREPVLVLAEQFGDIGEQDVGGIGPPRVSLTSNTAFLVGSSTASRRRSTVIGRITSRYLPRTYKSRRTSSAIAQIKFAIQLKSPFTTPPPRWPALRDPPAVVYRCRQNSFGFGWP